MYNAGNFVFVGWNLVSLHLHYIKFLFSRAMLENIVHYTLKYGWLESRANAIPLRHSKVEGLFAVFVYLESRYRWCIIT